MVVTADRSITQRPMSHTQRKSNSSLMVSDHKDNRRPPQLAECDEAATGGGGDHVTGADGLPKPKDRPLLAAAAARVGLKARLQGERMQGVMGMLKRCTSASM